MASEFANPNGYLVQASDSIRLELTFQSLVMEKLEGYFGNWLLPMNLGVGLFDTIPLPEPVADFEGMEVREVRLRDRQLSRHRGAPSGEPAA